MICLDSKIIIVCYSFRCIASTPTDSQLQSIERETANRSLFARELVVATLVQALPDLTQPAVAAQTPVSPNLSSAHISSPETPGGTAATAISMSSASLGRALVNGQQQQQQPQQDGNKKESAGTLGKQQQHHNNASSHSSSQHQQQTSIANQLATNASSGGNVAGASVGGGAATATVQSQNISTNPNAVTAQNTAPMVQTLMHVIPQPLVSLLLFFLIMFEQPF